MNSGSEGQAWVENLCHRFSTFCSEADDIISQLVEDVLPEFSVDSAGENGLVFPAQEQDVNSPALEMLSIGNDTDQDGKSCTMNSAYTLSSIVPVGERCTDIQSDGKDDVNNGFGKQIFDGDECDFHDYSLTSAQPPAANSSEKMEEMCTQQFPITESDQPSCCQKLEESIIMVNSDGCYPDSDMEMNYLSLENTEVKFCTLKKKVADERSFESVSQGIYSETDRMAERCCTELPCAKDS